MVGERVQGSSCKQLIKCGSCYRQQSDFTSRPICIASAGPCSFPHLFRECNPFLLPSWCSLPTISTCSPPRHSSQLSPGRLADIAIAIEEQSSYHTNEGHSETRRPPSSIDAPTASQLASCKLVNAVPDPAKTGYSGQREAYSPRLPDCLNSQSKWATLQLRPLPHFQYNRAFREHWKRSTNTQWRLPRHWLPCNLL